MQMRAARLTSRLMETYALTAPHVLRSALIIRYMRPPDDGWPCQRAASQNILPPLSHGTVRNALRVDAPAPSRQLELSQASESESAAGQQRLRSERLVPVTSPRAEKVLSTGRTRSPAAGRCAESSALAR
ncbi:hypothetical protein AOLI_G00078500 [Acnodon oligacanthus]